MSIASTISLSLFCLLALARPAWPQALQKLVTGWSSPSGNQAVIWVAKDGGSFQQQGLEVELIFVGAGSKMMQALLAGDIRIAQVGGVAPISARLSGADIKIVAVSFNTLALSVMAHKEIRAMADLKGKRIGISRYGSNTDFGIRYLLRKHGLVPDKDVAILQFGDALANYAALQAGAVQASIISYPMISLAKKPDSEKSPTSLPTRASSTPVQALSSPTECCKRRAIWFGAFCWRISKAFTASRPTSYLPNR